MSEYNPSIGITAGALMIKWDLMNYHIKSSRLNISPGDNINVFINFESVLENLSLRKDLNDIINNDKHRVVIELESAILNLVANYKMYFHKEKCNTKIYLYHTSLSFENQQMETYNAHYRSYYKNRYMQNPQFKLMGNLLNEIIIPEVKLILSYIPDCYFIESKTFDGSIIPKIISEKTGSKNIIISADIFDTLYLFDPNFLVLYLKGKFKRVIMSDIDSITQSIVKDENPFDLTIFNSELYYRLLISVKGSKIRNIKSASGFGYGKFMNVLKDGIDKDIILRDFSSVNSIIEMFPEKYRDGITEGFKCTGLDIHYSLLSDVDIDEINLQLIDKVDVDSLEALNNKRFLEFPINLQGLLE